MVRLMEQVIERLRAVPEAQQERVARFVLNELEEDERWSASTEANVAKLRSLSGQILADDAAGRTESLDPGAL